MATDKMYEQAFRYKGTKLWKLLYDDEVFAVRLSDGGIGYCSVMGMMGDHCALGLYVGDEGYRSYRVLLDADYEAVAEYSLGALISTQDCLQCSFENKDMLSDRELAEVRRYAEVNGRALRGKNAFPQFTRFRRGRFPWFFDSELDEQRICEALSAAVALKKLLLKYSKEELRLHSLREDVDKIPMMSFEDGKWVVRYTKLPSPEIVWPEPVLSNEVIAARLRRKKKRGTWECGTFVIPTAIQDDGGEDEAPYYPLALLSVELGNEEVEPPIVTDGEEPKEMLQQFAARLAEGVVPEEIFCGDDRCFFLLKDLCGKTGIRLERTDDLEALDDVVQDLLDDMTEDDEFGEDDDEGMAELFDAVMAMSDQELWQLPGDIANMLFSLAEAGELPAPLDGRIKKLFRRK